MPERRVRPYRSGDRQAVFRIAADTAFFGEPVEAFLEDRNLFCDFFYAYYTDLEPEHGWVACAGEEVVGFLMGSIDTRARPHRWLGKIFPRVFRRLILGGYQLGRSTFRYGLRQVQGELRGEHLEVDVASYPAHLHLNMAVGWRGQGFGRQLLDAHLGQMRALSIPGVHLSTTSANTAACRLYERTGFRLLSACPTRRWEGMVPSPIEERIYGMKLV
jgi:ribosomal protein S18 acetylase RimI-like enzyme